MNADKAPILCLKDVCLELDQVMLLRHISIALQPGSFQLLAGSNASGKTLLMRLMTGMKVPTSGQILVDGKPVTLSPEYALKNRFYYCGFDNDLFDHLSVRENILIGAESSSRFWFPQKNRSGHLADFLRRHQLTFGIDTKVSDLKPSERFLLRIARAVFNHARILLIDECDSFLNDLERERVLAFAGEVQSQGGAVILAALQTPEDLRHVDRIIRLKDGKAVVKESGSYAQSNTPNSDLLVNYTNMPRFPRKPGHRLISVKDLSTNNLDNIFFDLFQREIIGVCGLSGSGKSSFLEALAGLAPVKEGSIQYEGGTPSIGYLPETGTLFHNVQPSWNVTITDLSTVMSSLNLINTEEEAILYNDYVKRLHIIDRFNNVRYMSKGNQQKLMLAQCLNKKCSIFLLDGCTGSLDAAGKMELYNILNELAGAGAGIIMVSTDLYELTSFCDRVVVFQSGRITFSSSAKATTPAELLQHMLGKV